MPTYVQTMSKGIVAPAFLIQQVLRRIGPTTEQQTSADLVNFLKDSVKKRHPAIISPLTWRVIEEDNSEVVVKASYQGPERLMEALKKVICLMLQLGVIESSKIKCRSSIFIVSKKDGILCICIDFMKLNAISFFDAYLMPWVEDLQEQIWHYPGPLQGVLVGPLEEPVLAPHCFQDPL